MSDLHFTRLIFKHHFFSLVWLWGTFSIRRRWPVGTDRVDDADVDSHLVQLQGGTLSSGSYLTPALTAHHKNVRQSVKAARRPAVTAWYPSAGEKRAALSLPTTQDANGRRWSSDTLLCATVVKISRTIRVISTELTPGTLRLLYQRPIPPCGWYRLSSEEEI